MPPMPEGHMTKITSSLSRIQKTNLDSQCWQMHSLLHACVHVWSRREQQLSWGCMFDIHMSGHACTRLSNIYQARVEHRPGRVQRGFNGGLFLLVKWAFANWNTISHLIHCGNWTTYHCSQIHDCSFFIRGPDFLIFMTVTVTVLFSEFAFFALPYVSVKSCWKRSLMCHFQLPWPLPLPLPFVFRKCFICITVTLLGTAKNQESTM